MHQDSPRDTELLTSAREGDKAALEALLERHQARVYRFGLKMCGNPEDAQDVLQETLLAMARGVHNFRGASSLSTWLYSVARSFCIKKRRTSKFAPDSNADGAPPLDPGQSPDEMLAGKEVEDALNRAVRGLEPIYREVLTLRDIEGLSAPEVAEVLGITVQAVKSRLHRARVALRDSVAPALGVPLESAPASSSCGDVVTLFSQHLENEISADVCKTMEAHLAQCPRCRGACDSLRRTLALCQTAGNDVVVPPSVQSAIKHAFQDFLQKHPTKS